MIRSMSFYVMYDTVDKRSQIQLVILFLYLKLLAFGTLRRVLAFFFRIISLLAPLPVMAVYLVHYLVLELIYLVIRKYAVLF